MPVPSPLPWSCASSSGCRSGFGAARSDVTPSYEQFLTHCRPGASVPVRLELEADTETPVSAFLKVSAGESRAFLFESVEGGERIGRWSFLGAGPREVHTRSLGEQPDIFSTAQAQLRRYTAVPVPGTPRFSGGLVGYISYDCVRAIEPRIPAATGDELGFPAAVLMDFDTVVAFDGVRHTLQIIAEARCDEGCDPAAVYAEAVERIATVLEKLAQPLKQDARARSSDPVVLHRRTTRADFEASVEKARAAICEGECQQIVLSQRFDAQVDAAPFDLYRALRRVNPSPYLFFVQDGDRALAGSSPETLVRVEQGEVTVRPIAGTRRRGRTPQEDLDLEAELLADEKEAAEHVMLVDLGRNDVGRVAEVGTVRVEQLRSVERYSHVMHLVSQVRGKLAPGLDAVDVLRATFPAGTVSGSPKVRAMELIDGLEPARRGPYAGCVGYLDRAGNMEVAIVIRTLLQRGRRVSVQAGAGVVYDSSAEAEQRETVNKARALFAAVAQAQSGSLESGADDVVFREGAADANRADR